MPIHTRPGCRAAGIAALLLVVALVVAVPALGVHLRAAWPARARPPFPPRLAPGRLLLRGHGVVGTVEEIDLQARVIVVRGRGGQQRLLLLDDDTILERGRESIDLVEIRASEHLVAIGTPDGQGGVSARAVRVWSKGAPGAFWTAILRLVCQVGRFVYLVLRWLFWRAG